MTYRQGGGSNLCAFWGDKFVNILMEAELVSVYVHTAEGPIYDVVNRRPVTDKGHGMHYRFEIRTEFPHLSAALNYVSFLSSLKGV